MQLFCNHFLAKSKKTENVSTVGVDVSEWVYPSGSVFNKNTRPSVTFSTWDFGGQVISSTYAPAIKLRTFVDDSSKM